MSKSKAEIPPHLVVEDPKMREILSLVEAVAPSQATVLILGESGVGKDEIANLLHLWSGRSGGKFRAINCSTFTETLIESTLFGHERGAFTGAVATYPGEFEQAHGGTLFLDEIGELKPDLQAKLLRVLETKRIKRLGGKGEIAVDVRVIAGTNRNLEEEMEKGGFRSDLFHRLNMVPIYIPPLRERKRDLVRLIYHFLENGLDCPKKKITEGAVEKLCSFKWPGNIRDLRNFLIRLCYTTPGDTIEEFDIKQDLREVNPCACHARHSPNGHFTSLTLSELERFAIIANIRAHPGEKLESLAKRLGINRTTLWNLIKKYSINVKEERKKALSALPGRSSAAKHII